MRNSEIFLKFDIETSDLELEVLKSSIWKHTTLCEKVFSFIIISRLWRPIKLKFPQVCYFMQMLSNTKWEDWSVTITNSVQCLWVSLTTWSQMMCIYLQILHSAGLVPKLCLEFRAPALPWAKQNWAENIFYNVSNIKRSHEPIPKPRLEKIPKVSKIHTKNHYQ